MLNNRFFMVLIVIISLASACQNQSEEAQPHSPPATQADLDQAALKDTEEKTEAFANGLLDLSMVVKAQETHRLQDYFAEQMTATPWPHQPEPEANRVKWIGEHGWKRKTEPVKMDRHAYLADWLIFLDHFTEIEDVRFKVKKSTLEKGEIKARVYFFLIGRDQQGRREWVRGWTQARAKSDKSGHWRINHLLVESLDSRTSEEDLFSEVSGPAKVTSLSPPYGAKGNDSNFWRGAASADVNLDGLIDVYATGVAGNHLYLNLGDGTFDDVSESTWTKVLPQSTGPLFLDMDNDGDQDLFLGAPDGQILLENRLVPDGKLSFRDISLESGVGVAKALGFSAVAGDVNNDGLPDIYVTSYNRYGIVMPNSWHKATNGTPNLLFINKGGGKFEEEAQARGAADRRWSYAASMVDIDEDGDLDIYVANDYGENGLYLNKEGHFEDVAAAWGLQDPGNGMGVSFGDYDNDGDLDLHVTNMSSTAGNRILKRLFEQKKMSGESNVLVKLAAGNSLYENLGNNQYKNVTSDVGGFSAGWAWGGGFIDFDNDGREDLFSPNGFISGKSMKDT